MTKLFKRIITAACVAALAISAAAIPAMAGNARFSFFINQGNGNRFDQTDIETKDDTDPRWYITPESGSWNGYASDTWVYVVYSYGTGTPSGYRNIQAYQPYKLQYLNVLPAVNTPLKCEIKEQKPNAYTLYGTWCP